ncbi:MAG: hypothetical protein ACRDD1_22180, partial [Planctomycetia bacterium]
MSFACETLVTGCEPSKFVLLAAAGVLKRLVLGLEAAWVLTGSGGAVPTPESPGPTGGVVSMFPFSGTGGAVVPGGAVSPGAP